jgi:hypothetical protein
MSESEYLQSWDDWTTLNDHDYDEEEEAPTKPTNKKMKQTVPATSRGINQYPGVCLACGKEVAAKEGVRIRLKHSWRVAHINCLKSGK